MKIIEPCCYPKQLQEFFKELKKSKADESVFATESDWTFAQLLKWMIWLVPSGKITIMLNDFNTSTMNACACLIERMNCAVGCVPKPLVGQLNLILPKDICMRQDVSDFVKKYNSFVSLAHSNSCTEMLLMESEVNDENDETEPQGTVCYSVIANFNQTIDKKLRMFLVSKSHAIYSNYYKMAMSLLRIHYVAGQKKERK